MTEFLGQKEERDHGYITLLQEVGSGKVEGKEQGSLRILFQNATEFSHWHDKSPMYL